MAPDYGNWNVGQDSDDENEAQEEYYTSKDSFLFLIEATPSMLSPDFASASTAAATASADTQKPPPSLPTSTWYKSPATSKMEVILRSAYEMMRRKVFSAPRDQLGIMIFNTAATQNTDSGALMHCHLLLDLGVITAESVTFMKDLLEACEADPHHLSNLLAPNTDANNSLPDAIGYCSTLFRTRKTGARSNHRLLLVTDNDDPFGDNDQLGAVCSTKRKDLHESDYTLETFFTHPVDGREFDVSQYYGELVTMGLELEEGGPAYPEVQGDDQSSLSDLVQLLAAKEVVKRKAFSVPFEIGEGLVIGVDAYALVGEELKRKPAKADLNSAEGAILIPETQYVSANYASTQPLDMKTEVKKYFSVGTTDGEAKPVPIFFDEDSVRKLKTLGLEPSIKLLGFKPRDGNLRFEETIKHGYFLAPNEVTYSGSTRTFAALLKSMIKKDVVGLARLIARKTGKIQLVLLVPQEEKIAHGIQVTPPGIHVFQLPFQDDIREIGLESTTSVVIENPDPNSADELIAQPAIEEAKKIIRSLTNTYQAEAYPNPSLNFFNETLAAAALGEEDPEPVDKTRPKYGVINRRVGQHIAKLKEWINEDEVDVSKLATTSKKRPDAASSAPVEGSPEDIADWVEEYQERGVKMKNDDLKRGLKLMGQSTGGIKAVLIERVEDTLQKRGLKTSKGAGDDDDDDKQVGTSKPRKKSTTMARRKVVKDESDDEMDED